MYEVEQPGLGADDTADLCLDPRNQASSKAEAAAGGPTSSYCSCVRDYGYAEVERSAKYPDVGDGIWTPKLASLAASFWPEVDAFMRRRRIARGASAYGRANSEFDWTATFGRRWFSEMRANASISNNYYRYWVDCSSPACDQLTAWEGTNPVSYLELNTGCVYRGVFNDTYTEFGGPVLEWFNFRRALRTLQQLDGKSWQDVLPPDFLQTFTLLGSDSLLRAVRLAKKTLVDLLGGGVQWSSGGLPWDGADPFVYSVVPSSVPGATIKRYAMDVGPGFDKRRSDDAFARLTRSSRIIDPQVSAVLGNPPYLRHEFFNMLRYWVQRTPGGGQWESVHNVLRLSATDPGTGAPVFFVKYPTTLEMVPGDWLAMMLGLLTPGWDRDAPPAARIAFARALASRARRAGAASGIMRVPAKPAKPSVVSQLLSAVSSTGGSAGVVVPVLLLLAGSAAVLALRKRRP